MVPRFAQTESMPFLCSLPIVWRRTLTGGTSARLSGCDVWSTTECPSTRRWQCLPSVLSGTDSTQGTTWPLALPLSSQSLQGWWENNFICFCYAYHVCVWREEGGGVRRWEWEGEDVCFLRGWDREGGKLWICVYMSDWMRIDIVWADPSLRYTSMLLGHWLTNKQQQQRWWNVVVGGWGGGGGGGGCRWMCMLLCTHGCGFQSVLWYLYLCENIRLLHPISCNHTKIKEVRYETKQQQQQQSLDTTTKTVSYLISEVTLTGDELVYHCSYTVKGFLSVFNYFIPGTTQFEVFSLELGNETSWYYFLVRFNETK